MTERKAPRAAVEELGAREYLRWIRETRRLALGTSRPAGASMCVVSTTLGVDIEWDLEDMAEKIRSHADTKLALKCCVHSLMRDALRGSQMGLIIPKRPTDFKRTKSGTGTVNRTVSVFPHEKARLLLIAAHRRTNLSQLIRAVVRRYIIHAHLCSPVLRPQLHSEHKLSPWPFYGSPRSYLHFSLLVPDTQGAPKGGTGGGTL